MTQLSNAAMRMSTLDRTKQELNWYTDGIYLCTDACTAYTIAAKIEAECKRRNIEYGTVLARDLFADRDYTSFELVMASYDIYKICIYRSLEAFEAFDEKVQKLHADSCVPALKKKQLADWAVTTFNKNWNRNKEGPYSSNYLVWIQPESEVQNPVSKTQEEHDLEVETHRVYH